MGNERGSSSSSSRKGKKSNSDKPKQPQRGLGVAQLEKIRLHGQMGSSYNPSLHGPYPGNFNQVNSLFTLFLFSALWLNDYISLSDNQGEVFYLSCGRNFMKKEIFLCVHAGRHESADSLFVYAIIIFFIFIILINFLSFLWFPPQHDGRWTYSLLSLKEYHTIPYFSFH